MQKLTEQVCKCTCRIATDNILEFSIILPQTHVFTHLNSVATTKDLGHKTVNFVCPIN